ncbi:hypothetical protein SAMN05443575_1437 [Jatrophihabitans endophyticus]|uniref:OCRE domain-containing protein n=1 Tax=Jatrophihabitans endophyticus TaxID=1206085 RepID=A0A1M5H8X9_9ACTN|nr:OCRE domain-containing protein [Jatrophihabitans endophyticus]SHG12447.1 hypothetical protein SAMN05443575_1437 [Jatrophihabitans endophyticus]
MAEWGIEAAYQLLMSPTPYSQASASAMMRNFSSAAQLMAQHLRQTGATASSAGDAGVAAQQKAEAHAAWFDQVASNSGLAADHLDRLVTTGNEHQATAEEVYAGYRQAVASDTGPNPSGEQDKAVIVKSQNGSRVLSAAVNDWGDKYSGFTAPAPPPVPKSAGAHPARGTTGGGSASGGATGSGTGGRSDGSTGDADGLLVPSGGYGESGTSTPTHDRGAGVAGSVEVGPDGGDFAGWYRDPRTGYYIDPQTGREFDPATSRWVDPVTGKPFGDVTQYATSLQGLGPAATTGGLLSDTGAGAVGGAGGGSFGGLFAGGGATGAAGVSGAYGGVLPPSLVTGSAGSGSLWRQAGRTVDVKAQMAANLVAREQAVRSGRPYLPPTQAGLGAGAATAAGRTRPGYLTADGEEASLFSSRAKAASGGLGRVGALGAAAEEEGAAAAAVRAGRLPGALRSGATAAGVGEEAGMVGSVGSRVGGPAGTGTGRAGSVAAAEESAAAGAGRRPYLPPTQAGAAGEDKRRGRERPDWLVEDDAFTVEGRANGVLGE